jgi:hypothetical protein
LKVRPSWCSGHMLARRRVAPAVAALLRSRSRRRRSGRCPAGVAGGVGRAAALLRHRVPNSTSTRGSATDTVTSHGDDDPSLVPLLREQIAALDARVARIERQERRVRRFRAWLLEWLHPSAPPPPPAAAQTSPSSLRWLAVHPPRRPCAGAARTPAGAGGAAAAAAPPQPRLLCRLAVAHRRADLGRGGLTPRGLVQIPGHDVPRRHRHVIRCCCACIASDVGLVGRLLTCARRL